MKIWHFIPYSITKDLGQEYNACMRLIPEDDAACFTDGDSCFLTSDFGHIIYDYVQKYPDAVLTCKTNRIHRLSKQLDGDIDMECDMRKLHIKAEERKHLRTVTEILPGEGLSGVLMVVPKKIWMKVPFVERGLLGIDSQFRIDLHNTGIKIYIMDGIFVYHSYRLLQGASYKAHLI